MLQIYPIIADVTPAAGNLDPLAVIFIVFVVAGGLYLGSMIFGKKDD